MVTKGSSFCARVQVLRYSRAASTVRACSYTLRAPVDPKELPFVGAVTAEQINEILSTGSCPTLDRFRLGMPWVESNKGRANCGRGRGWVVWLMLLSRSCKDGLRYRVGCPAPHVGRCGTSHREDAVRDAGRRHLRRLVPHLDRADEPVVTSGGVLRRDSAGEAWCSRDPSSVWS